MASINETVHLPKCPMDPIAYDRLYAFNGGVDDYSGQETPWQFIRLKPRLSEVEVYRKLPHASKFEYGGYVTKSRVCFCRCDVMAANMPKSKSCTFHSHPSGLDTGDVPSESDVFQFLYWRHLRSVTVGVTKIWVWDKTKATMTTVRALARWSETNMLSAIRKLEKKFPGQWRDRYVQLVLNQLGLRRPKRFRDWESRWPEMLRDHLHIKVRVFPRDDGDEPQ